MTLNQKDPMLFWIFFYKLTPQLIPSLIMIELHALHWKVQVFFPMYSQSHYKRVKFFILGECITRNKLMAYVKIIVILSGQVN